MQHEAYQQNCPSACRLPSRSFSTPGTVVSGKLLTWRLSGGLHQVFKARAYFDRDAACDPQNAYAWYSKALAEERTGQLSDAVRSYERFLTLAPATDVTRFDEAQRRLRELRQ